MANIRAMGMIKQGVGCMVVIIGAFLLVGACATILVANDDKKSVTNSPGSSESSNPVEQPDRSDPAAMVGNGSFNIGGVDGKEWGVYETIATGSCQWSIRSVSRYREGLIVDTGAGNPGETLTVNIQPDGDVRTFTGEIDDDHRLVFMTNGCGTWRMS
jgi:hypothetical protein